jgi:hypothetical protein
MIFQGSRTSLAPSFRFSSSIPGHTRYKYPFPSHFLSSIFLHSPDSSDFTKLFEQNTNKTTIMKLFLPLSVIMAAIPTVLGDVSVVNHCPISVYHYEDGPDVPASNGVELASGNTYLEPLQGDGRAFKIYTTQQGMGNLFILGYSFKSGSDPYIW